jgi:hypothetical protein
MHQMWNDENEDAEFLAFGIAPDSSGRSVVVS